jgi:hypothetical protein
MYCMQKHASLSHYYSYSCPIQCCSICNTSCIELALCTAMQQVSHDMASLEEKLQPSDWITPLLHNSGCCNLKKACSCMLILECHMNG